MPVNEASGTPGVSVPLYEVRSGSLTLPLSLSYHASGIRVADRASWAGLGWSLNAGGVVTRVPRGLPDDDPAAFPWRAAAVPQARDVSLATHGGILHRVADNLEDFLPDLYTFNVNGLAGTFMQRNAEAFTYCTLPLQPVHIAARDTGFVLTNAEGVAFWFRAPEYAYRLGHQAAMHTAAWYLERIVSADKADTIRFEYAAHGINTSTFSQRQTFLSGLIAGEPDMREIEKELGFAQTPSLARQSTQKLRRIWFRGGRVEVTMAGDRLDVVDDRRLTALHVVSSDGADTLLRVRLFHSYFESSPGASDPDTKRLRLDSVRVGAGAVRRPAYRFRYNSTPLPHRQTGSRDHWGYANGARTALSASFPQRPVLIPAMRVQTLQGLQDFAGADRTPNPAFVQAGLLTAIEYPTGGSQALRYEPNTVPERFALPNPQSQVQAAAHGPGDDADAPLCANQHATTVPNGPVVYARLEAAASVRDAPATAPVHRNSVVFTVTDLNTGAIVGRLNASFGSGTVWNGSTEAIALEAGHQYQVSVRACGYAHGTATLLYETGPTRYGMRNKLSGGVRVRELQIQPDAGTPATTKRYYYHTPGTNLSSGYALLPQAFVYSRVRERWVKPATCNGGQECPLYPPPPPAIYTLTTITDQSMVDATSSDRPVGYTFVTVVDSAAGQRAGRTESEYRGAFDAGGGWYPPVPTVGNGWQRDQLVTQSVYATPVGGKEQLVARTRHDYAVSEGETVQGFTAARNNDVSYDPYQHAAGQNRPPFVWENTYQPSGWAYKTRTREYRYAGSDTAVYQLATTWYRYGNPRHQQPTVVQTALADGRYQQVRARYAGDYDTTQASTEAAVGVRELLRTHQVARLVEQTTLRIRGADTVVTAGTLTLPRRLGTHVVAPGRQLRLRAAAPQPLSQFAFSALRQGALHFDPGYAPEWEVDRYDAQGRILQYHTPGGPAHSFLWDSIAGQPIAQGQAMRVDQMAYTSFEPGATGRWAYAPSGRVAGGVAGRWAYALAAGQKLVRDGLPTGAYELSFWATGAPTVFAGAAAVAMPAPAAARGSWRLYRLRLPATSSVRVEAGSGAAQLDEVRLHPAGAPMTTFTYDPLRGVTAQTDAAGRTTTYEYDALGRLVRTRDEQGRILTEQEYHYARP